MNFLFISFVQFSFPDANWSKSWRTDSIFGGVVEGVELKSPVVVEVESFAENRAFELQILLNRENIFNYIFYSFMILISSPIWCSVRGFCLRLDVDRSHYFSHIFQHFSLFTPFIGTNCLSIILNCILHILVPTAYLYLS